MPGHIQRAVYAAYRPGQETGDGRPSKQWIAAAHAAIAAVQLAEGAGRPEFYCSRCGRWAERVVQVQPGIKGDATHSIPDWESVTVVHGDDRTLEGKECGKRMTDIAALAAFKEKLKRHDRAVLVAALSLLAVSNPDVPELVENIAEYWQELRRPRKPEERRNEEPQPTD